MGSVPILPILPAPRDSGDALPSVAVFSSARAPTLSTGGDPRSERRLLVVGNDVDLVAGGVGVDRGEPFGELLVGGAATELTLRADESPPLLPHGYRFQS